MSPVFASPVFAGFTQAPATHRLPTGGLIDRAAPLPFTFDGRSYQGLAGDTLASALMANGVRLLGRSFKYHRPRGLVAAGIEEPNALVELRGGAWREPNIPATTVELFAGLEARSQNRFPSLSFDLMAVNGLAGPIFSAGFYYKTFMWPASFWERVYEPLIRRAAGLGRAPEAPDPDHYERGFLHADLLVIGAGPAGLAAALAAGRAGARVILADQDSLLGGRLLSERDTIDGTPAADWARTAAAELRALPNVRVMPRTTVFGAYDGGFGAIERNADHLPAPEGAPRQTYWRIATHHSILAAGAFERPLVFPGNDRPGIMLAGAVRTYLNRFAAIPGHRAVVVTSGVDGWDTVADLQAAGIEVAAVVDRRADAAPRRDTQVFAAGRITRTAGRLGLETVTVTDTVGQQHVIRADLLAMAGGWSPNLALTVHTGGRPRWDEASNAFLPGDLPPGMAVIGAASGCFGLADALRQGTLAGHAAAAAGGFAATPSPPPAATPDPAANAPIWLMPGNKAFVDFQHDVTAADVALSHREGFRSVEHLKRYTTLGMATDQGKLSNVNGLALLAGITGAGIAATGTTMFRAPTSPVTIGALAGHGIGPALRPTRLTPAHDWAKGQGAVMTEAGAWLRAGWFPRPGPHGPEDWLAACTREVNTTRTAAGLCDVSTLGKIELVGPDVGTFLDRLYANTVSTLQPGRVRYGLMLREDGFVFDDGTVARLEPGRWLMTTTTAQAAAVLAHMEFCHQVLWPGLAVAFTSVTDQWAQFSVAGPRARDVLAAVVAADLSDAALPYMGCLLTRAVGAACRVFRISFSGELAFEIAVPARSAEALATALMAAGSPLGMVPYGLEALGVMRIEKGHPAGNELNGQTTAQDLGMARMLSKRKDFIGRAMAGRPALTSPDRPTLVGLLAVDRTQGLRAGAHLLPIGAAAVPENDEGWITSAAHSPTLGRGIALAMLKNGPARIGQRVLAWDHIRHAETVVEVVAPCFVDPPGSRLR